MYCQLDTLRVYYERRGQGRPLLTISGAPADHRIIKSWLEPIFAARAGWERIYFDQPGTGRTAAPPALASLQGVLEIVLAFIDAALPGQAFALLGLSAGAHLARGVAHLRPQQVDGLCLLVPWLGEADDDLPPPVTFAADPAALAQLPPGEVASFNGLTVQQSHRLAAWYRRTVIPAREGMDRAAVNRIAAQPDFAFDLNAGPPFAKPALILAGRQDAHVGYRRALALVERYPRATTAVLDWAGHALGVEHPALFPALLNDWLDRVAAEPDSPTDAAP